MSEHDDPSRDLPQDQVFLDAVEAVVFASPEPVSPAEIAEAFEDVDAEAVEQALERLVEAYAARSGGLLIERVAGGYRFATRPRVGEWVRRFFRQRNRTRLTPATLEVLAIVAYRQPVTAPEIQALRGKDPSYALKVLLEKKLVRILGRKKVVGNPLMYGTTPRFLEHFGLNDLSDLPSIEEFDSFLGTLESAQASLFEDDAEDAGPDVPETPEESEDEPAPETDADDEPAPEAEGEEPRPAN